MRNRFLIIIAVIILISTLTKSQDWGNIVTWDSITTTHTVYSQKIFYGTDTVRITDLRYGNQYSNKESYNIKGLTISRAWNGSDYFTNVPVIFFVHGGGWTDGYEDWYKFVAQSFSGEKGWITISVDYRLTSDSVFIADDFCPDRNNCDETHRVKSAWYPDNINDVADAFQWTIENIGSMGGDVNKIFVFGHSAGGHLVSLLATHSDYQNIRSYIKGVISMSGAYQIKTLDEMTFSKAIDLTFLGGYSNNDAELDSASPANYISSGEEIPPFYLLHCGLDLPSLPEQKIFFKNRLELFNKEVYDDYLFEYSHVSEMTSIGFIDELPTQKIISFIENNILPVENNFASFTGEFALYQNFPNPFNPVTVISFQLPVVSKVQLKVYDILGNEVAKLINETKEPGIYKIKYDGGGLPSGIYFYALYLDRFKEVRPMVLLK
ncbi:MAG: carboxylesterase family protein [bacterium]